MNKDNNKFVVPGSKQDIEKAEKEITKAKKDIDDIKENFIDGMHFHYFSTMKDAVNFNFGK